MFCKAIVRGFFVAAAVAAALACCAVVAQADVFNMGPGLTNLETVSVLNKNNQADSNGHGAVGYDYKMGKYEVTVAQYCEFLNAVADDDTYGLYNAYMEYPPQPERMGCNIQRLGSSGSYDYKTVTPWANRPVNWVSWGDAARFANWLHNGQPTGAQDLTTTEDGSYYLNGATSDASLVAVTRKTDATWVIPTENEWYKAAYHKNDGVTGNYWDYPTSSDSLPSNDLINPDPGNNANFSQDGYTIGNAFYRTPVGEFEKSESPYGTFDQGGNVWEWNEALIGSARGLRGGTFGYGSDRLLASGRNSGFPSGENAFMGFRVANVPEPGSIIMLAGIALTALLYWWRKHA
jgi:formylglycine-generating enzyme required for sulfatase activity